MEVVIKYKNISYNIKNFGCIVLERVGNPKNPASPYITNIVKFRRIKIDIYSTTINHTNYLEDIV